ncbi:MAG: Uma2 family endonuclease [Lachnospiraceae bacterium]|jgi:Uma2 family endonuclease|nr:Uma2 family endonuclease [Lachnospiraceae bacterium]
MEVLDDKVYTIADILALPEDVRAELIDGKIYLMPTRSTIHQQILGDLSLLIGNYIEDRNRPCRIYMGPLAVFINDERDCVEPDIVVICDPSKIKEDGCHGAPDWVIEIISPSTASHDYLRKAALYSNAGVREYWIVDPNNEIINVYNFGDEVYHPTQYDFDDQVKVGIYEDFVIDFTQFSLDSAE